MRHGIRFGGASAAVMRRLTAAVVMCTALGGAMDAKATVVVGTISGLINYGRDDDGVFGAPGATLDGLSYTGSFTYDTSKGARHSTGTLDEVFGGDNYLTQAVLTYALTINGITDLIDVSEDSFVTIFSDHQFRLGGGSSDGSGSVIVHEVADGALFDDLDAPFAFADTVDGPASPYFGAVQRRGVMGHQIYYVNFDTERVDFVGGGALSGTPEPSAWAMMLAGFFAVGGALRQKTRSQASLSAEA